MLWFSKTLAPVNHRPLVQKVSCVSTEVHQSELKTTTESVYNSIKTWCTRGEKPTVMLKSWYSPQTETRRWFDSRTRQRFLSQNKQTKENTKNHRAKVFLAWFHLQHHKSKQNKWKEIPYSWLGGTNSLPNWPNTMHLPFRNPEQRLGTQLWHKCSPYKPEDSQPIKEAECGGILFYSQSEK